MSKSIISKGPTRAHVGMKSYDRLDMIHLVYKNMNHHLNNKSGDDWNTLVIKTIEGKSQKN